MKLKYAKMHGVLAAILGGLSLFLIPSAVAAVADGPNEKVPFKLGVAGFTFKARTVDDALAIMQKADVHYLCVKNFHLPFEATDEEIASFKSKCALYSVTPYAIGPIYDSKPEDVRSRFEFAKRLGVKIVVGVPFEMIPDAENKGKGKNKRGSRSLLLEAETGDKA